MHSAYLATTDCFSFIVHWFKLDPSETEVKHCFYFRNSTYFNSLIKI